MTWLMLALTAVVAVLGARWSLTLRDGSSALPVLATSLAGGVTWIALIRHGTWSMLVSTVAWDAVYNGCWVATTILLDGDVSPRQVAGAVLVVVGLLLMQ